MRATTGLALSALVVASCATTEAVPRPRRGAAVSTRSVGDEDPYRAAETERAGQDAVTSGQEQGVQEHVVQEQSVGAGSGADWPNATPPTATSDGLPIHGSLATRFRGQSGGGDHDSDLYALLTLDVRDPHRDPWSVHVLGTAAWDLDNSASPTSPYFSLQDTREDPFTSTLYEAWVESRSISGLDLVRLGRQSDFELPAIITYDGVRAESREMGPGRVKAGAYGGALSRVYTASQSGNAVFGAYVAGRPWKDGRVRVDYMHLEDATVLGEHNDDLAALTLGQGFGQQWRVDGNYSRLESESRDASLRATYANLAGDLTVQASWYRLFTAQNDLALELDPFTEVLLEQSPYTQGRLSATKSFGKSFQLEAGSDVRRVSSSEDVAEFNRDFERWYATTTFPELLPAGIALSLTGEIWDAESDETRAWGLDLSRKIDEKLRVSAGSYYSLYKYDLFQVSERDHVRTYYVKLRYRGGSAWSWDVRYEHEVSFADYDLLRMGVIWSF